MSSNTEFVDIPDNAEGVNPNHPHASHIKIIDAEHGVVERTRDKLAVVGFATSTRDLAPFDDPEWDIAGLNQLYRMIPRADIWMDIHVNWDEENVEGTDHEGWIRDCGIPVLMSRVHSELPTSVSYPVDAVIAGATDYLTSSVAFYIAWAIHQGYKEVALYGIDLVVGTEYEFQKSCAEFWIGVAHGKGMKVTLPPQCALLKQTHRYGYEIEPDAGLLPLSEIENRTKHLMFQRDKTIQQFSALNGAIGEVETCSRWIDNPGDRLKELQEQHSAAQNQIALIDGAAQESSFMGDLVRLRTRGATIAVM